MRILKYNDVKLKKIRLVTNDGTNIVDGIAALKQAQDQKLDLVCISEQRTLVCKIFDKQKEEYKKNKEKKNNKQKALPLKEVQFKPNISSNDYNIKLKRIKKFLTKGHKVKVIVRLKGRELKHTDIAHTLLKRVAGDVDYQYSQAGLTYTFEPKSNND